MLCDNVMCYVFRDNGKSIVIGLYKCMHAEFGIFASMKNNAWLDYYEIYCNIKSLHIRIYF